MTQVEDIMPVTALQEGMLFHAEASGGEEDPYLIQIVCRSHAGIEADRLEVALNAVMDAHPNLRVVFRRRRSGEPVQVVLKRSCSVLQRTSLTESDPASLESLVASIADTERRNGLDLRRGPLMRFHLVQAPGGSDFLILTCHHALIDGWSVGLLLDATSRRYAQAEVEDGLSGSPSPVPTYQDYLEWAKSLDTTSATEAWSGYLAGVETATLISSGARSASAGTSVRHDHSTVPSDVVGPLIAEARRAGVTINTLVQAVWAVLLAGLTRRNDVTFGATVSGRPGELPNADKMIGLFINTVPVRARWRPDESLITLAMRIQREQSAVRPHQSMALSKIHSISGLPELFDTVLLFQNYPEPTRREGGLAFDDVRGEDATHYPVSVVVDTTDSFCVKVTHAQGATVHGGGARLHERFTQIVRWAAHDPTAPLGLAPLILPDEADDVLRNWNTTPAPRETVNIGDAAPIGRAIPGDEVRVVGLDGQLLPPETDGELLVSGKGLARGYVGDPSRTATAFIPDPYGPPGSRAYRTGDLARWRLDGQLVYTGRVDHQVKVRGHRVELAEVERAIAACPGVSNAVVVTARDPVGVFYLVAYVVGDGDGESDLATSCRKHLQQRLPHYMVPSSIILLDRIPVTAHGKVDHNRLPEPPSAGKKGDSPQPRTRSEQQLAYTVAEVLGVAEPDLDATFFDLGGDSLSAARLVAALAGTKDVPAVTIPKVYAAPSLRALATMPSEQERQSPASSIWGDLSHLIVLRDRPEDARTIVCIHGGSGIAWGYTGLLPHLAENARVVALQAPELSGEDRSLSVRHLAQRHVERLLDAGFLGPIDLIGWSFGGVLAHAMADLLSEAAVTVSSVILLDAHPVTDGADQDAHQHRADLAEALGLDLTHSNVAEPEWSALLAEQHNPLALLPSPTLELVIDAASTHIELMHCYRPRQVRLSVILVEASRDNSGRRANSLAAAWQPFVEGQITCVYTTAAHSELLRPWALAEIGPQIERYRAAQVPTNAGGDSACAEL